MERTQTRQVKVGNIVLGGNDHVVIQSMCSIKTEKVDEVVAQIKELEDMGCEMIRVSVLDYKDADAIKEIVKRINIPLIADIHFNYLFALKAMENGAAKIRLNPGNLRTEEQVVAVIEKAKEKHVPIRIGVNSGSINPEWVKENGGKVDVNLMLRSLDEYIKIFEDHDFHDLVLALKSSDALQTLEAYRAASKKYSYPLHIGVTETSYKDIGLIRSSVALVPLLLEGIGNTMRISLSDDPVEEIKACKRLLHEVGLYPDFPTLISCPTCGRTMGPIIKLCREVDDVLLKYNKKIKVAVMGCVVNGLGEGKGADIGFACSSLNTFTIFEHGQIKGSCSADEVIPHLVKYLETK